MASTSASSSSSRKHVEVRDYAQSVSGQEEDIEDTTSTAAPSEVKDRKSKSSKSSKGKWREQQQHKQSDVDNNDDAEEGAAAAVDGDILHLDPLATPTDGLEPLTSYLSSLEDRPCTLLDLGLALSYASYPTPQGGNDNVASASQRPPIRIWNSTAFSRLMHEREWVMECLTIRSQAILREFLLELSNGTEFPSSLKLEFLLPGSASEHSTESNNSNVVFVDFSIGRVAPADLPRHLRQRYHKGLAVLTGSPRKELESLYITRSTIGERPGSSAGRPSTRGGLEGHPSPRIPSSVSSTSLTTTQGPQQRTNKYVHKASLAELTAFAFETFRRQPCLIAETEAGKCFMQYPWHETSLGPLNQWPPRYVGYVTVALSLPTPMILGLGPDYIQIYNDGYIEISGDFHPEGFGKPAAKAWGSIWEDSVGPLVAKAVQEKKSFSKADHLVWQQPAHVRYGVDPKGKGAIQIMDEASLLLLETYHTFSYSPLTASGGKDVDGYVALDIETTDSVVARRRLATARDLQLALAPATSMRQLYDLSLKVLQSNPVDLPFVLLFSVHIYKPGQDNYTNTTQSADSLVAPHAITDEGSASSEMFSGSLVLRLQGSCGLPDEHRAKYAQFLVHTDDSQAQGTSDENPPCPFPLLEAIRQGNPVHTFLDESVASQFEYRSWQSISKRAVVCPIQVDSKKIPDMVMVVGLNSRRIYKDIYRSWLEELSRCLRSGLVSAQKVAREQRLLRNLRKLDEAKTAFFTGVSHELRTPLTLINGPAADALNEPGLSPLNHGRFALIAKASNRLLRLVNSLLDFASVDAGRLQTNFQPVYLARYIEDLASLFRSAIERAGLRYRVEIHDKDAITYTDPACVEKIVYNLISNALKYTSAGTITVRCFTNESSTVVEIEDTGVGIPEDQLDDIFKRFHRISNKISTPVEGTGIGLALTKELSRVICGDLTVESRTPSEEKGTGGGSIFRLILRKGYSHLPVDSVKLDAKPYAGPEAMHGFSRRGIADELMDAFTGGSSGYGHHNSGSVSGDGDDTSAGETGDELVLNREANILVVDDHDDLRNYITSILGGICRSVTGVSDGEAALRILKTNARIDLVVSDIMMPKMNGFQLLNAIRTDPVLAQMPVILLSARAGSEVTAEGLEMGATDYLPKPFASKELIARVRTALATAKNSRRLEALVQERTAELAASEKRAERLMSVLPVGVFEVTSEGYVVYTNETFRKMCNWHERKPFYLDTWYKKVRPEDRPRVADVLGKAMSTGGVLQGEETYIVDWQFDNLQPDGSRIHCFCHLYPTGDSFVGVLTDITPSVRLAEQALQHEKQRSHDAINLARSQESFLDVVSHELRNPLSAILNCADLCTANHETIAGILDQLSLQVRDEDGQRMIEEVRVELDEAAEGIQGIIASARHQSLIAGDILSVSKFNRGLLTVTPIDICLSRELRTILSMFEMQTRATSISLELRLSQGVSENLCISADPTRLTQILVNLISNSCRILENYDGFRRCAVECLALASEPSLAIFRKGTDEGLSQLDQTWYLPADAPPGTELWLLFLVRDSGPGISSETQAHLFTKFNQAQASNGSMGATRSAVGGGAGLGLYLAKKLAEMMGGSMMVKSVLGHGADFIFYLKTTKTKYVENKEAYKSRLRGPKLAQRALGQGTHSRSSFSTINSSSDGHSNAGESQRTVSPLAVETFSKLDIQNGPLSPPISNRNHLRVLVCEDNLLNQKLLHRQLSKAGIETMVANNGLEAIDKLMQSAKEGRPMNVCLMDLEMPVCGGIEATMRIRALEREGELPGRLVIYAVTGNARGQHAKECEEAGMDSTIVKPYDFKEMLVKLDSLQIA